MENNFDNSVVSHSIKLLDRTNIFISGAKKVINFNDKEFFINTVMGDINIKGNDLELIKLDTNDGNLCIKGKINGIIYSDNINSKENSFLYKLFK